MAFILPAVAALGTAIGSAGAVGTTAATVTGEAGSILAGTSATATFAAGTPWLAEAGIGAGLLGGATSAFGSIAQGQAQKSAAEYNAKIASENAAQAKQNAAIAGQSGAEQAAQESLKTRAEVGAIKANQAAAGLDVNSGSAVDVRSSARELGELDALTVRSNAARQAYGYQVQGINEQAQSNLDRFEGEQAETAGDIGAASDLLNSFGSSASNWERYQLSSGIGSY